MRILYIGHSESSSTSLHRANALRRIGNKVILFDPYIELGFDERSYLWKRFNYSTGYYYIQNKVLKIINKILNENNYFDVVWVDGGELFGIDSINVLKKFCNKLVLYNHDDPTGQRDGGRFNSLLKAIPAYDLCAVVRHCNLGEYKSYGAKKVLKIWMGYDEIFHAAHSCDANNIPLNFRSEVAFIGSWMRNEGRDKFLLHMAGLGVPISIWGDRWNKSPLWNKIKPFYRGQSLTGREYVAAIQGAKICLGFLSKGNRDLHTTRSLEIPYAGGMFLGERTIEHLQLYKEGIEAEFWGNVDECAKKCIELLNDDYKRVKIRDAGMQRIRKLNLGHEDQCKLILNALFEDNLF